MMTREELKQEANKYAKGITGKYVFMEHGRASALGYLAGAEPREKQIQIDAEQIQALQKQNEELTDELTKKADINHSLVEQMADLESENAELRKVAEFQQSSNMNRHFENKKLKEGLAVGSTFNKALNSMNKNLEEERDKYRNMVFELQKENAELKEKYVKECEDVAFVVTNYNKQLTKAKEIIRDFISVAIDYIDKEDKNYSYIAEAEQFLNEVEK